MNSSNGRTPSNDRWYLVATSYACAGVCVRSGKVIDAAPIYRWMKGKQWEEVKRWKKIQQILE